MSLRLAAAALPCLIASAAAFAAPATPEGAAALKASLETYLGATPGVVTVAPEGEIYKLAIDVEPLAALIPAPGLTVDSEPYVLTVTDQGGGMWGIVEDSPFSLKLAVPGAFEMEYTIGAVKSEGVWDASIRSFQTYTATITDMKVTTKSWLPDGTLATDDSQTMQTGNLEITGTPGATGGADVWVTMGYQGYSQTMTIPPMAPGAPMQQVVITAGTYGGTTAGTGIRTVEMLDLLAWFVGKGSAAGITEGQAEMKPLLIAALPLWDNMTGALTMTDVKAASPVGEFGIASIDMAADINGLVPEGKYAVAVSLDGLTMPPGLVPDWGRDLVPTSLTLDGMASRFNAADPARMFIEAMDLTNPDIVDPATGMVILGALLPEGDMDITLSPSRVASPIYEVKAEGLIAAGPGKLPAGSAKVTATGMDRVQAALAAAPPEVSGQFLMPLGMAAGLARTEPDGSLAWDIEFTPAGSVVVNGTDLTGGAP